MQKPHKPGWFWFLPHPNFQSPTGLLRLDQPVIVLVGVDKVTRDMPPPELVVRFSADVVYKVTEMWGDWEPAEPPQRMKKEALRRQMAKRNSYGN